MTEIVIRMRHIRAANLCARGAREWFVANELDWRRFLDEGYPADQIEALGDAFGNKVVAIARQEASDGR